MSRVNMFNLGVKGIDMKSNPLTLAALGKLHFSRNMVFEEGVIKTRPPFHYRPLGCKGVFQGAASYQPSRGISASSFADADAGGVVVCVGGSLFVNCENVSGETFCDCGNVNLYQAENYLVLQCPESDTYWWDTENLIKSPGMGEVHWEDTETPTHTPVVEKVVMADCASDEDKLKKFTMKFIVVDSNNEKPLPGSIVNLFVNENEYLNFTVGRDGSATFPLEADFYTADAYSIGYADLEQFPFTILDGANHIQYLRMFPLGCSVEFSNIAMIDANTGVFTITNTGNTDLDITGIGSLGILIGITLPVTIPAGESLIITITAEVELPGSSFTIATDCGNYTRTWPPTEDEGGGEVGSCGYSVLPGYAAPSGVSFSVRNTGTLPLEITLAEIVASPYVPEPPAVGFDLPDMSFMVCSAGLTDCYEMRPPAMIPPGSVYVVSQPGPVDYESPLNYSTSIKCGGFTDVIEDQDFPLPE